MCLRGELELYCIECKRLTGSPDTNPPGTTGNSSASRLNLPANLIDKLDESWPLRSTSESNKVNEPMSRMLLQFEHWKRSCDATSGRRLVRMARLMLVSSEHINMVSEGFLTNSIASNLASCGACPGEAEGQRITAAFDSQLADLQTARLFRVWIKCDVTKVDVSLVSNDPPRLARADLISRHLSSRIHLGCQRRPRQLYPTRLDLQIVPISGLAIFAGSETRCRFVTLALNSHISTDKGQWTEFSPSSLPDPPCRP